MIPQLDLQGLVTALASAGLLTFAIVYVARSRRTAVDLDTPLSQAFSADLGSSGPEMFSTVVVSGGSRGLGLVASAVMHLLVAFFTPLVPYLFPEELRVDFRKYQVKMVEFRVPQRLMYEAPDETKRERAKPRARVVGVRAARAQAPAQPTPASARPRFQLPEAVPARNRDVVIQPDQPPDAYAAIPQALPRIFLWAQAPTPLEESRTVGAPPAPPRPFSLPHTQPEVRRPNLELAVGNLQIGAAPVTTFRPPNLPVPAANISPLSVPLPEAPALGELPATPLPPGSPMNLVVLLQNLAASAPAYLIGVGNRLPDSGAPGAGASGGTDAGEGLNPDPTAQGVGQGTHADLLASAPNAASADATGRSVPTGRLGVIIVQQSAAESGFEGSEVLTGQPVYTVYLDVPGSRGRWTLQYCVPAADAGTGFVQPSEGRIQIAPRRSVQPPYPINRLPVDVNGVQATVRRLVVYAQVSESGEIQNVRLVRGAGLPVDETAVATLQRWTFRPATRGDAPVAIEALFGIPLD